MNKKLTGHKVWIFDLQILLMVLICLVKVSGNALASEGYPVIVTDMDGIPLRLESSPRRIISLSAGTTELLYSLGAGDRIIGVTDECNYPPRVKQKDKVGGMYLDFEKIVTSRPDLVVAEVTLRPREVKKLRRLGLPVLAVRSDNYSDFLRSFEIMGRALGCSGIARKMASKLDGDIKSIMGCKDCTTRNRPRVFVEIWDRPLMTAGGDTFINFVINSAGGENVFKDTRGYPQVNPESLILRDPQVIILTTSTVEELKSRRLYRSIQALRNGRVYRINPDILARPTTRLYKACRILNRWFYPEVAEDSPGEK